MDRLWTTVCIATAMLLAGCQSGQNRAAERDVVTHRVNAGADAVYIDQTGRAWQPDGEYDAEIGWGAIGGTTLTREGLTITGTDAPQVYTHERYGMSAYRFDVDNGRYSAVLHFAETWPGSAGPGSRAFAVSVNDVAVDEALDVHGAVGFATPLIRQHGPFEVIDERIDIQFHPNVQNTLINGIEIIRH